MVFFSCDGCGEMLKKNQVDAHARKCYNCEAVSCVDCSVSFWGDDYRNHTSCITEAERYEKSTYKGPKKNDTCRKLTPQELWMAVIRDSLDGCPPNLKAHVQKILGYDNVPRKEKAFRNFASNSLRLFGREGEITVSSLWKHFSAVRQKQNEKKEDKQKKENQSKDETSTKNGEDIKQVEGESMKEKGTTNKNNEKTSESVEKDAKVEEKIKDFNSSSMKKDNKKIILKAIKKALKKAPKREMKFKEIRQLMKEQKLLSASLKKDDQNNAIKLAVTKGKKSLRIDGKKIMLIEK